MATQFFPLEGCKASATAMKTALIAGVLHLFKSSFVPDPSSPTSAYTAAECDYDDYVPLTLSPWNDPGLAPGTGYMIGSPLVQFAVTSAAPAVGNVVGGCYLIDSNTKNRITIIFTDPIPMEVQDQVIPINIVWLFPTGV